MAFTGSEDHSITLQEAEIMTENYRDTITEGGTIAHYFGKGAIEEIFNQDGCVGMRVYYGLDSNGEKQLIIVGVLSNKNDLYLGKLAERSIKCPQDCPAPNPLNS